MITVNIYGYRDLSSTVLPGIDGFVMAGEAQLVLSSDQFDGVQISNQVSFSSVFPEMFNEVVVLIGENHFIDGSKWRFGIWDVSETEPAAGNHIIFDDSDGDDRIIGSSGMDGILCEGGNDIVSARQGRDFVVLGDSLGSVTADGGSGTDTLEARFYKATADLTFSLAAAGSGRDIGNGMRLSGFEVMTFSSGSGNDRLIGGALADSIYGNDGNDTLSGGAGDDTLHGGAGADRLAGGNGADLFEFFALSESNRSTGTDMILRLDASDRISLSSIDAIDGEADDAFTYIGSQSFSGHAGELRVFAQRSWFVVAGDTNGDKVSDLMIVVAAAPVAENFIL